MLSKLFIPRSKTYLMELLFLALAALGAIAASITDVREGIIPNKLSFSLLGIGIVGNVLFALYSNDVARIFALAKNLAVIFVIGYVLWLLGLWSAGDAKEFLFLAALLPQYPDALKNFFAPALPSYPFSVVILTNTFLAVFPFLLLYSFYASRKKVPASRFLEPLKNVRAYLISAVYAIAIFSLGALLNSFAIAFVAFTLVFLFLESRGFESAYKLVISSAILAFYIVSFPAAQFELALSLIKYYALVLLLIMLFAISWNSLTLLRREALQEEAPISQLKEGMILGEEIYTAEDKIIRDSRDAIEKIKDAVRTRNMEHLKQKPVLASTKAAGVSREEIEILRSLVEQGKLEDRIRVKRRMPFAPVILIGLVTSLVFGSVVRL